MANFLNDILDATKGEEIEKIVIFEEREGGYGEVDEEYDLVPPDFIGKIKGFNEVIRFLNYEYNDGFGGMECHGFYLWTKKRVYYVHEYDGSTSICSCPRNPEDY